MVKVDNGTADSVFQKMYKFEQTDIDLIVELLQQDLKDLENPHYPYWNHERCDHIKDLINEFSKL